MRARHVVTLLVVLAAAGCGSGTAPSPSHTATAKATSAPSPTPSATTGTVGTVGCPAAAQAVSSTDQLRDALSHVGAGGTIVLAAGVYEGNFTLNQSGSDSAPISLCGPRSAVLEGQGINSGYTLHLDDASWVRLEGFSVEGGQKGVVLDGSDHDLLYGLYVHGTGDEAVHLREFSSYDTVSHCVISSTGHLVQFYGEGIYVGSAHSNWCRYTACQPDRSDYNVLTDNNISDTTAENIDIKEGTTGGQIIGNTLNGAGMVASAATSWVNVKGNDWLVTGNKGTDSDKDGFSVHQVYPGWGYGNVFRDNQADVNGPGYGVYVQSRHLNTVVACSNSATGAELGLSNLACS
jgi:hypothetical protein